MSDTNSPPASLYVALIKAQGEFDTPQKKSDGQDGNRKFKYADLEELIGCTRPALSANGLGVMQPVQWVDGAHVLDTILVHTSGEVISYRMILPADFSDIKKFGAVISYLRRYAYQAILCIAADDMDAEGDSAAARQAKQVARTQQKDEEKQAKPYYSDEELGKHLETWKEAIAAGKTTPERIIKRVSSEVVMTPKQIKTIQGLANANGETQQQ